MSSKGRIAGRGDRRFPRRKRDVRKYDLLYENGRWLLDTVPNQKTEQSIQNAFKNALDTQKSE